MVGPMMDGGGTPKGFVPTPPPKSPAPKPAPKPAPAPPKFPGLGVSPAPATPPAKTPAQSSSDRAEQQRQEGMKTPAPSPKPPTSTQMPPAQAPNIPTSPKGVNDALEKIRAATPTAPSPKPPTAPAPKPPTTSTPTPAAQVPSVVLPMPRIEPEPARTGSKPSAPPSPPPPPIKTATPDIVLFNDEEVDANVIADLLFESIGGQELLTVLRFDTVNGEEVNYQPVTNLDILQQTYNPRTLLPPSKNSEDIFRGFAIPLNSRIPNVGNGPDGSNAYYDTSTGSIVLEFVNLQANEQIEVEIATSGTIYEAGI